MVLLPGRRFETALKKAEEIIALDNNYPQGHLQRGYVLCELGRATEGVASVERSMELMPDSALAQCHLSFALSAAGRRPEALAVATELKRASSDRYVKPMFLCMSFAAAGEMDEAFHYLDIAVNERDPWLCWLGSDPKLSELRADPRFDDLYQRSRIPLGAADRKMQFTDRGAALTSIDYADADTAAGTDVRTLEYTQSYVRRNAGKLSAAALVLVAVIAAYSTGFLQFSILRNTSPNPASAIESTVRTIAVLPFENATGDTSNDYLADGMSDLLISRLSSAGGLRVISRSSTVGYRGSVDPISAGKEVGAQMVVTGSVQKRGDIVTFQTQARNADDGTRLFTLNFTEPIDKIVRLQETMVSRVLERLELPAEAKATPPKSYTENNEAFQLYLQAEYHRQKGTPDDSQAAIELYQRAIAIDPNYGLAYQGLAFAFRSAPAYGALSPLEAFTKARDAAQRALEIDPALSGAYVSARFDQGNIRLGFRERREAVSGSDQAWAEQFRGTLRLREFPHSDGSGR